jgi:hypothetical protein
MTDEERMHENAHRRKTKLAVAEAIKTVEFGLLVKLAAVQELTLNPPNQAKPHSVYRDKGYQAFRQAVRLQLTLDALYHELTPGRPYPPPPFTANNHPVLYNQQGQDCLSPPYYSGKCVST